MDSHQAELVTLRFHQHLLYSIYWDHLIEHQFRRSNQRYLYQFTAQQVSVELHVHLPFPVLVLVPSHVGLYVAQDGFGQVAKVAELLLQGLHFLLLLFSLLQQLLLFLLLTLLPLLLFRGNGVNDDDGLLLVDESRLLVF
jgi:hypothetical protein